MRRVHRLCTGSSALLAALVALACSPEGELPARQALVSAEAPLFTASALRSEREVWRSDAALSADRAAWSFEGAAARATALGWVVGVEESGEPVGLRLDVALDADMVESLHLDVDAAPPLGRVRLRWSTETGGPHELEADLGLLTGGLHFPVATSPEWSGTIRGLEWRWPRLPDGQRLLVRGVRGLVSEADGQKLAAAVDRPWRVDLRRDVRPALLALPGVRRELPVKVPEGAALRLQLGVTAPRPQTTWVVRVLDAAGGRPFELMRETLEAPADPRWLERRFDLAAYGGREIRLELEVTSMAPWRPGEGLPLWGNPEILSSRAQERPDLVLVSADTLRADHLSLYGYPRPTSPRLDRWAKERGIVFRRALAPAPWTLPSHASMFTGLDVLSHGVTYGTPAPAALVTLAETLREAGYATYAETGGGYLHPAYGLGQGFDVFRYPASKVPGASDLAAAVERARAFAEAQPGPVFLFLHSYETHEPYTARPPHFEHLAGSSAADPPASFVTEWVPPRAEEGFAHRRRFVDAEGAPAEDPAPVIDLYDSRVANLDAQLGGLFEWVKTQPEDPGTALLLTSDHGESLGEDGRGGHASLGEQLLHIPLVLSLPDGRGAGTSVEARVRLIDVMPTLLELAGLAPPELDGASLLGMLGPGAEPRVAWSASPSTNAGITLEDDERFRFERRAAAWAEGGLPSHVPLVDSEKPSQDDVGSAQRRIVQRLEAEASGLELLFINGGEESLRFTLQGSGVQNHRVKSWDVPPRRVFWHGQVHGVGLRLEPGDRFRLFIETPRRGDLEVRVPDGARWQLDLEREALPLLLAPDDGGSWGRTAVENPPPVGLRLRWRSEPSAAGEDTAEVDAELQRQLEALGYVG